MSRGAEVGVPVRAPMGAELLAVEGIEVAFGRTPVLAGVDLTVAAGEVVALVGPNGAGKSTLLGAVTGDVVPSAGEVRVEGRPLSAWSHLDLARRRAVLPQQSVVSFPFTVREVVSMGRTPWARTPLEDRDDDLVDEALAEADVAHLVHRGVPSLSGGERARVALARVLVQHTQVLLLDEPTAALDVHHQELVLEVARRRARDGAGVVAVLHDLGLAAAHADRVAVLSGGHIVADGPPVEVMTAELLSDVYGHEIEVIAHPRTGELLVVPVRQARSPISRSSGGGPRS